MYRENLSGKGRPLPIHGRKTAVTLSPPSPLIISHLHAGFLVSQSHLFPSYLLWHTILNTENTSSTRSLLGQT